MVQNYIFPRGEDNPAVLGSLRLIGDAEREFGEPIRDIIIGLRRQRSSWSTVAGVLGIGRATLYRWRKKLDIPADGRTIWDMNLRLELTPTDKKARKLGYEDAWSAINSMRFGEGLIIYEVADRLSVCVSTVMRYSR